MARKAIEILKARGYTDAELTDLQPMFTPKFCSAIEAEDAERERLVAESAKYQADLAATTDWYHKEAVPALNKALGDATTARGEAARVTAQLKYMQETGLARIADQQDGGGGGGAQRQDKPGAGGAGGNGGAGGAGNDGGSGAPEFDSRYVSTEVFTQTADRFGEAIAVATDIAEDHRDLFGSRLPGGVTTLRKEYQDAVKNHRFSGDLRAFWENKFNVQAKQTERSQTQRQKELDDYANDKVAQARSEMLNPMTRMPVASRNPFTVKAGNAGTTTGKQPWEGGSTVEQRRSERVVRFAQKAIDKSA